jgi:hypothetical protein
MKPATEILDEIIAAVMPRQGVAIGLRETSEPDSNWREGADPRLRPQEVDRLASITDLLHRRHPYIDWSGITATAGSCRRIAKVLDGPTDCRNLKCGEAVDEATPG